MRCLAAELTKIRFSLTLLIAMGRTSKFFFPKSTKQGVNTEPVRVARLPMHLLWDACEPSCSPANPGIACTEIVWYDGAFISLHIDNNPFRLLTPTQGHWHDNAT
jgi:hypothetical protein